MAKRFTTKKTVSSKGKSFYQVRKKGKKGVYKVIPKSKGMTKKKLDKQLNKRVTKKKKSEIKTFYRVLQAKIYKYDDERKMGQIRVWVFTHNPKKYSSKKMREILRRAEIHVARVNATFRANLSLVNRIGYTAREVRQIESREARRRSIDSINIEVAGMGLSRGGIQAINFIID